MLRGLIQSYFFTQPISSHRYFLCLLYAHAPLDGWVYNHNRTGIYENNAVNEGDEWSMEVDLRSRVGEKRTLHWFVRGKQQKGFITGVPIRVQFGV